jgi:integrase
VLEEEDLAKGTIDITLTACRQFEEFMLGTTGEPLDPDDVRIVAVDLAEWRSHMTRAGLTPGSIQRKLMGLRLGLKLLCPTLVATLRWPKVRHGATDLPVGVQRTERNSILRACEQMSPREPRSSSSCSSRGRGLPAWRRRRLSGLHLSARSGKHHVPGEGQQDLRGAAEPIEAREALRAYLEVRPDTGHDFIFAAERAPHDPISRGVVFATWQGAEKTRAGGTGGEAARPHQARHDLCRRLLVWGRRQQAGRWLWRRRRHHVS